ncbi:MAG TPA: DUF493 domain-containing protein [Gammaproteobacteria bacterium]|nr:DUF493 domain-containing protein [Gammaproteobacteria bacterium]
MAEDGLLSFPCDLPIKVLGRNDAVFRGTALRIVRTHYGDLADTQISEQESRNRSYLSLTFIVRAQSREEADALFRDLTSSSDIIMVF